jgi:hypothetical protein
MGEGTCIGRVKNLNFGSVVSGDWNLIPMNRESSNVYSNLSVVRISSLRAIAKQSKATTEALDCFVAKLLAMTFRYDSAFSRRGSPEACKNIAP